MPDTLFIIHLVSATTAVIASYALLMSLLQREINMLWTRGESILALMAAGAALGTGYMLITASALYTISILLLLLGLILAFSIVVFHRFLQKTETYSEIELRRMRIATIVLFGVFIFELFTLFAAIGAF
jgi:hypothetical protein